MIDNKLDGKSFDIVKDNISKLKELFPEVVTGDNEVDIDALVDIFRENDEKIVEDEEHYQFTWWGKKEAKRVAEETTTKTLRPYKKESKNWDTTKNIYIEGDNLDALKILLGSYRNRIKMIYIDPPYNTGHDFVYKDNRGETTREYLETTGQLSDDGYLFENGKTDGKFHSNWLNMMYPRLILARKLLTDDGVIFISIDENEFANLKNICDEIFGEENFRNYIVIRRGAKNLQAQFDSISKLNNGFEFILMYSKNPKIKFKKLYKMLDKPLEGGWNNHWRGTDRPTMRYTIFDITPTSGQWRWSKERSLNAIENYKKMCGELKNNFPTNEDIDKWYLNKIKELNVEKIDLLRLSKNSKPEHYVPPSNKKLLNDLWIDLKPNGSSQLSKLFSKKVFDTPKSIDLIERLVEFICDDSDIILDFFSGSASTAHSIIDYNNLFKTNHSFIVVQIPEAINEKSEAYKAGFENISEIGKERIRRAGDIIVKDFANKDLDIGFKVFKIDESNFIPWNPQISIGNVEQAILSTADNLVDGRSELDLIYELLLKRNMDLNCPVEETDIKGKKVYIIDNGFALICLEDELDISIADDLLGLKEDLMVEYCQVILKDGALDDNSSININEKLKSNNVEFYTI